ncbi:MAG TPA: GTPase Era, partial [Bacteroidia bacterium]|nr:GTPase Era [Bacteroidia bacterium]
MSKAHKSGWVSVVGNPNVGKSTLVNALVGEKMSIVTHKPQTTRHRITAIANDEDYQMVFSDTPGVIKPHYKMQEAMMKKVGEAMEDADIIMAMTDTEENGFSQDVINRLRGAKVPIIAVLNKVDLKKQDETARKFEFVKTQLKSKELIVVSALHGFNVPELKKMLISYLPEGEPFFPKEQ